jgi:hypothetical protein
MVETLRATVGDLLRQVQRSKVGTWQTVIFVEFDTSTVVFYGTICPNNSKTYLAPIKCSNQYFLDVFDQKYITFWWRWEGGGDEERAEEGKYGGCILYSCVKMGPYNCSKKTEGDEGLNLTEMYCKHTCNTTVYPSVQILSVSRNFQEHIQVYLPSSLQSYLNKPRA